MVWYGMVYLVWGEVRSDLNAQNGTGPPRQAKKNNCTFEGLDLDESEITQYVQAKVSSIIGWRVRVNCRLLFSFSFSNGEIV